MQIDSPHDKWSQSIDLDKTKVIRFPSYIFLCGGKKATDDDHIESCRSLFYKYAKDSDCSFFKDIVIADDIFSYYYHSSYDNLWEFEEDLAQLSALTLIFPESAGSLAELGAFSVLQSIQKKLLVVIHSKYAKEKSFIWRGIVKYLKRQAISSKNRNPIAVYHWKFFDNDTGYLQTEDFQDAFSLSQMLENELSKLPKTQKFKKDKAVHEMLLMLDMLKAIKIANLNDILYLLMAMELEHNRKIIKKRLSLLETFGLVVKWPHGDGTYFIPAQEPPRIEWGYKPNAECTDLQRWMSIFFKFYQETRDNKYYALRSYYSFLKIEGKLK